MESNDSTSMVDVRVIVSGPKIGELVSKAIDEVKFQKDYNIIISSIIPTNDLNIAKKVASGADIILIGGYGRDETYNILYNQLKTDFNHIGLFDYNNIVDSSENINSQLAEEEIINSIIKAGLSYSLNIINIHVLENKLANLNKKYDSLLDDYNQAVEENKVICSQNQDLADEIKLINQKNEKIKSDFSDFKLRFEDIHSKNILEVFNLSKLWENLFNEKLESLDKIVIATDKFKPEDIVVGQGYICAKDKQTAIDWLKIIRTTLILLNNTEDDLKDQLTDENDGNNVDYDYEMPNNLGNFF